MASKKQAVEPVGGWTLEDLEESVESQVVIGGRPFPFTYLRGNWTIEMEDAILNESGELIFNSPTLIALVPKLIKKWPLTVRKATEEEPDPPMLPITVETIRTVPKAFLILLLLKISEELNRSAEDTAAAA